LQKVGVEADRKLSFELDLVLKNYPSNGVILVTDGYTDESILPLIQSRVPVNSVRRIVVKHSESIEETAAVFSRYLKILMENPHYSRLALGIPGILILVFAVSLSFGLVRFAWAAFFIIIGASLFIIGFGFQENVSNIFSRVRQYSPSPLPDHVIGFSTAAGFLLIIIGCFQAGAAVMTYVSDISPKPMEFNQWLALFPGIIGRFAEQSITLVVIGICVLLSGVTVRSFLRRDGRLWGAFMLIVVIIVSRQIFLETSLILINPETSYIKLIIAILTGISVTVFAAFIAIRLRKQYGSFFREKGEESEIQKN
jgi:putative membrane protein